MSPEDIIKLTRRDFLATSASGIGALQFGPRFNRDSAAMPPSTPH
jgi:hypothetical protein